MLLLNSSLLRVCSSIVSSPQLHQNFFHPVNFVAWRLLSSSASNSKNNDKQHIVVALGGNALLKRGEPLTVENQRKNIRDGISSLSAVLRSNTVTFVHGNGPQVGLLALEGAAYQKQTGAIPMQLDVLDAETEGSIGYMLEQEIDSALGDEGRKRGVITMLSQIIVSPNDEAFNNPTKFIGPVYSLEEANKLGKPVKQDGQFYRQVVPSPQPIQLIDQQLTALELLTKNDVIVICGGGGGIPVIFDPVSRRLTGIEAVIDKDRAACMLGKTLGADGLMILTDVEGVAVNKDKPDEKWIKSTSPAAILELADNFPSGSMGPKVSSAIDFVQTQRDRWCRIGSLKDATSMLEGKAGTKITNEHGTDHLEYY
eukprot:scaffold949_cov160-Skeletonema_dohrnii-CCMP3373.AAC.13